MIRGVTGLLVIANVAIFLVLNVFFRGYQEPMFNLLGLHPDAFWAGMVWQPLTSMFLHGSLSHILFNMLALWSLGTPIEQTVGRSKFTWLYFVSGLAGSLLVIVFQGGNAVTVGASGAILGLLGAMAVFYPRATVLLFFIIPMKVRTLAILFGIGSVAMALFDVAPGISHLGHLGGLLGGLLYAKFAIADKGPRATSPGGIFGGAPGGFGGAPGGFGGGTQANNPEVMREMLRDFMRDPRGHMNRSGGFMNSGRPDTSSRRDYVDDGGFDSPYDNRRNTSDIEVDVERPKKLYFDQATGRFFFK